LILARRRAREERKETSTERCAPAPSREERGRGEGEAEGEGEAREREKQEVATAKKKKEIAERGSGAVVLAELSLPLLMIVFSLPARAWTPPTRRTVVDRRSTVRLCLEVPWNGSAEGVVKHFN
jgi:hypothetical protein